VENVPVVPPRRERWLAADEWMSDFLRKVSDPNSGRRRRAVSELNQRPWDARIRAAADYDLETEHYRRLLHGQHAA
jgi:hypothetical protein